MCWRFYWCFKVRYVVHENSIVMPIWSTLTAIAFVVSAFIWYFKWKHKLPQFKSFYPSCITYIQHKEVLNSYLYFLIQEKCFIPHRSNHIYPSVFTSRNISKIRDYYSVQLPTVIVFHGWWGSETSSYERNVTAVYLTRVSVVACDVLMEFAVLALRSFKVAPCAMWRCLLWQQHFSMWCVRNG
jgi:hypothetical protein